MPELDLTQTLRAAASGDAAAWTGLVAAYSGRVFGLLVKQCGDRDLAEELTQATFVKIVEKLTDVEGENSGSGSGGGGYEERGRFESWLFRIAMNKLRDEARRKKRQARTMDMSPGAGRGDDGKSFGGYSGDMAAAADEGGLGESPDDQLSRAEQVQRMRDCIEVLPAADREILHLRHTAGLSFAQIAETLKQPLGTVLARGHRALGKLKKMMIEDAA